MTLVEIRRQAVSFDLGQSEPPFAVLSARLRGQPTGLSPGAHATGQECRFSVGAWDVARGRSSVRAVGECRTTSRSGHRRANGGLGTGLAPPPINNGALGHARATSFVEQHHG